MTGKKGSTGIIIEENGICQKLHIQSSTNPYYFGRKDYMIKLNDQKKNHTVKLNFLAPGNYEYEDLNLITVNKNDTISKLKELKGNALANIEYKGNEFKAKYHAKKDQIVCVTIPYSKGWNAMVDGKKTKVHRANGMFMGIEMKKGSQKLRLQYETPGLKIGGAISLISYVGIGILALLRKKDIIK